MEMIAAQMMIEDGANFKGSIQIEKSAEKEATKRLPAGGVVCVNAGGVHEPQKVSDHGM